MQTTALGILAQVALPTINLADLADLVIQNERFQVHPLAKYYTPNLCTQDISYVFITDKLVKLEQVMQIYYEQQYSFAVDHYFPSLAQQNLSVIHKFTHNLGRGLSKALSRFRHWFTSQKQGINIDLEQILRNLSKLQLQAVYIDQAVTLTRQQWLESIPTIKSLLLNFLLRAQNLHISLPLAISNEPIYLPLENNALLSYQDPSLYFITSKQQAYLPLLAWYNHATGQNTIRIHHFTVDNKNSEDPSNLASSQARVNNEQDNQPQESLSTKQVVNESPTSETRLNPYFLIDLQAPNVEQEELIIENQAISLGQLILHTNYPEQIVYQQLGEALARLHYWGLALNQGNNTRSWVYSLNADNWLALDLQQAQLYTSSASWMQEDINTLLDEINILNQSQIGYFFLEDWQAVVKGYEDYFAELKD
ncbi:hypothetical protein CKF58_07885 [Psittacicella hinzii]|uniref:Uncharacterized protein n=1 Tax=Psittacicella hinzii TaxID=2028575 RepID=A0A3A1YBX8_9GAMM|nr:hypothetical protein CKF58_07885 [Psittacicella hinzii]